MDLKKGNALFNLGLLVMALLLIVSCGPTAEPPAEATPAPVEAPTQASEPAAAPSGEPILFGMVAPMTGDAADYGVQLETGVRLAIDEINAAGGIDGRPVELEICDDKCDPYEASLCAQKMTANEDVMAVIGHVCSSCTLAGGPIYEKAGLT
ncbi:MAG TPA: ABC transporter substrate-binding protein, partial [Anaerolineae bacterium]|nr:ABC transporter substrate-binding protein [Anaerolineae bacterium]